jgi:hypothetical protein
MAKRKRRRRTARPTTHKLIRSGDYDEAAMAFFRVMAMGLDATLQEAGVEQVKLRRRIVDDFIFETADFFDQQWLEAGDGKRYFPILCFGEQHPDDGIKSAGFVDNQAYHESVSDIFDEVTNKGRGPYDVKIGYVGVDEPLELD